MNSIVILYVNVLGLLFRYGSRSGNPSTRRPAELALHLNVLSQCSRDKRFGTLSIISLRDSDIPSVTALMLAVGVNSLVSGAFQYRHFFRLQLVPHITKHHQVCVLYHLYCFQYSKFSVLLSHLRSCCSSGGDSWHINWRSQVLVTCLYQIVSLNLSRDTAVLIVRKSFFTIHPWRLNGSLEAGNSG
jgi:hypothetical protein